MHAHHRRLPQRTASMSASAGSSTRPKLAAEFVAMGARYVSTGTDLGFLLGACGAKAKEVRDIKL